MMKDIPAPIIYTCRQFPYRERDEFIAAHVFICMISGVLTINNGKKEQVFKAGDFFFLQRDQLAKIDKRPATGDVFISVSINFDQQTLRNIYTEYDLDVGIPKHTAGILTLTATPLLKSYIDSLLPHVQIPDQADSNLFNLKIKEAVFLLLASNPELAAILFNFTAPGKTDLKAFMLQNYQFNVGLDRFAYLTGRSLATFKRDFDYIFHVSPGRWIQHQRLKEAYYQIKERGKSPADVYQEVGFESITDFSYSFKRLFGVNPSSL